MKVSSHNEWDPLRAVVVGTLDGFAPGLEYADSEGSHREAARLIAREAFPQWYLDEVAEDLDGLCATFRTAGVETFRPAWSERTAYFSTPNWAAEGFDIYNVRDLHIVFGNTIVSSAPSSRFRLFEPFALREVFYRHFFEEGFRWIAAPPPRLRGEGRQPPRVAEPRPHRGLSLPRRGRSHLRCREHHAARTRHPVPRLQHGKPQGGPLAAGGARLRVPGSRDAYLPFVAPRLDDPSPARRDRAAQRRAGVGADVPGRVEDVGQAVLHRHGSAAGERSRVSPVGAASRLPATQGPGRGVCARPYQLALGGLERAVAGSEHRAGSRSAAAADSRTRGEGVHGDPIRMRHPYTMLGGLHCTTLDVVRQA